MNVKITFITPEGFVNTVQNRICDFCVDCMDKTGLLDTENNEQETADILKAEEK